MPPEPLYRPADLHPAYQLRYSWAGWPSKPPFPTAVLTELLPLIASEWEQDGVRVLESASSDEKIHLTLSTTPQVAPVTLAARVKGRIQHHCRQHGTPVNFSRKLAVRSLGDPTRAQVEAYIRSQVGSESLADEKFRALLESCTAVNPAVDLSQPTASNSGRYWYNLHLVLVLQERYRIWPCRGARQNPGHGLADLQQQGVSGIHPGRVAGSSAPGGTGRHCSFPRGNRTRL